MAPKLPSGSSSSGPGGRPRAQVAYEGEDEFSMMSLEPSRKKALKDRSSLSPDGPGRPEPMRIDELKATNEQGFLGLLRRIFAK
jgi:hypothetical protein